MPSVLFGPALRILPVGLFALSLQRLFFARHPLHDVKLQFVLAVVVAAGVVGGPDRGAVVGFVFGLLYDLSGTTPLGLVALAYGLGGMSAGYVHSRVPEPQWWLAMIFATIGAVIGELTVPLAEQMVDDGGWITARLLEEIPVVAVTAGLMCPALMPVCRWMVGVKRKKWKVITE
ncbi:MAG: rod shape-determining protein MreD [Actinobacteria bacterium]|nr:rod shape-determining protein MreD [Actinomycetota bacterium]